MPAIRLFAVFAAMTLCAPLALAQKADPADLGLDFPGLDLGNDVASAKASATLTEDVTKPGEVLLSVKITMTGKSNTYGVDSTSPYKTKFDLQPLTGLTKAGEITPDHEPKVSKDRFTGKDVGKYVGEVTFSQRFQVEPGAARDLVVAGTIKFLFCDENYCNPKTERFSAKLTRSTVEVAAVTSPTEIVAPIIKAGPLAFAYQIAPKFRLLEPEAGNPVVATLELSPANAKAGDLVKVTIKLALKDDWHTYSKTEGDHIFGEPTTIEFDQVEGLEAVGEISESPQPGVKKVDGKDALTFYNKVTWEQTFKRVGEAPIALTGSFRIQVCEGLKRCLVPKKQAFAFGAAQTAAILADATAIGSTNTSTGMAAAAIPGPASSQLDLQGASFDIEEDSESTTVWGALFFAFIGGLTLNIMPCVLPVLAIKILSIVQQAGESRSRILVMNIVYALGVISVFAVLATLAAVFRMGWGQQFQQEWFRVATVLVVFVCGLNLLGVFEILLPGMLSQVAGGGDHREGLLGAFMTGVFATLLATPCSTGYMTYALAWSVKQPTPVIYLVWCTMGVGMALPYLLIGVFPWFIKFLPRPGMWMVQFKQLSAFAMFGAAVWFLIPLDQRNVLPVLTACVGLGLGLWMIGSMYDRESSLKRKSIVRTTSLITTALICTLAFWMHTAATSPPPESDLPWVAFSQKDLLELRKAGKPILIDFTADWCAICKQNEHLALNTINTADFVRKNGVTAMVADFTDENEEIQRWLNQFKSISVPLTIVIPPDPKAKVLRLSGAFSERKLLETLEKAMGQKGDSPAGDVVAGEPSKKMAMSETATPERP